MPNKTRYDYSKLDYAIGEYITGPKSERNREILRQYYLKGYSQAEIAGNVGMSEIQVGRIIREDGNYVITKLK